MLASDCFRMTLDSQEQSSCKLRKAAGLLRGQLCKELPFLGFQTTRLRSQKLFWVGLWGTEMLPTAACAS